MKVGFAQFNPKFDAIEENLSRVEKLLENVSSDVIVLPEMFATGYLFPDADYARKLAEPTGDGQIFYAMVRWAKKYDCLIVGGFPEIHNQKLYNSSIAVQPDGKWHLYRKIHLFDREKLIFQPGNIDYEPFEFRGAKLGMLICFDWIFPESYRVLMLKGTQIILHPSNLVLPYCQKASFARAVENRMFIILTNRTGSEKLDEITLQFTGGSIIYSPRGEILAKASENEETVKVVDINPAEADDKNVTPRNNVMTDRRPEYYRYLIEKK